MSAPPDMYERHPVPGEALQNEALPSKETGPELLREGDLDLNALGSA